MNATQSHHLITKNRWRLIARGNAALVMGSGHVNEINFLLPI